MFVKAPKLLKSEAVNSLPIIDDVPAKSSRGTNRLIERSGTRRTRLIIGFGLIALLLKLMIARNTFGSTDSVVFYTFAKSLSSGGLEWTYRHSNLFNHPPLTAYYLQFIFYLDHQAFFQANGWTFPVLLRLPGILADFVVLLVILEIRKKHPEVILPDWALVLLAFSPVSLMVSGFHGNTDPIMVMFLVLAAYMGLKNKPALAGLLLALSAQIKIISLLFFPIFFFFWYHRNVGVRFSLVFVCSLLLLWAEPLLKYPEPFMKDVLNYSGFWGLWGITYWLRLTGLPEFGVVNFFHLPFLERLVVTMLKLAIIVVVLLLGWRRRALDGKGLLNTLAYAWIIFFIFTPAASAQYLTWLAPFVLLLAPVLYSWLTASSALFLFFFYNITAREFPWYFAMSTDKLNLVWTPWTIWPWAILICGMVLLWKQSTADDPSLRLFSFQTLRAEARG